MKETLRISRTLKSENPDVRWRAFDYEELLDRDKASLDIFRLKYAALQIKQKNL